MKKTLLLLIVLFSVICCFSQDKQYVTETDTHIFWQPDRKLTAADFQYDGSDHPESIKECDSLGYCVVGAFGLFHVLDVTKGKYKPGKYREKLYIAPAFQKTLSCMFKEDSLGIEIQQVVFDIEELKAKDCYRFVIDKPIEKKMVEAEYLAPSVYKKNSEQQK